MSVYQDNSVYAKYLKDKITSEGCSDCENNSACSETKEGCGCCPAGLVSVYDESGLNVGCLTPADAEAYQTAVKSCPQGYVALWDNTATKFLGCVSESEFAALYAAINP